MSVPSETKVIKLLSSMKDEIIREKDFLTINAIRIKLEEKVGVVEGALKVYKTSIRDKVDEILLSESKDIKKRHNEGAYGNERPALSKRARTEEIPSKKDLPSSLNVLPNNNSKALTLSKTHQKIFSKFVGAPSQHPDIKPLKELCKAISLAIPPSIYAKNTTVESLDHALREYMARFGLVDPEHTTDRLIKKLKAQMARNRELDGIDSSNIIASDDQDSKSKRRPTRHAAAAAAALMTNSRRGSALSSDSEEDEDDEEEEEEEEEMDSQRSGREESQKESHRGGEGGRGRSRGRNDGDGQADSEESESSDPESNSVDENEESEDENED